MTDPELQTPWLEALDSVQTSAHDLVEGVPDLRLPSEALVWKSPHYARVLVDLRDVDQRFKARLAGEVSAGLRGRGKAVIDQDGYLRIVFGVTDSERTESRLLEAYLRDVMTYLKVSGGSVLYASVDQVAALPETTARVEASLGAFVLRSLTP